MRRSDGRVNGACFSLVRYRITVAFLISVTVAATVTAQFQGPIREQSQELVSTVNELSGAQLFEHQWEYQPLSAAELDKMTAEHQRKIDELRKRTLDRERAVERLIQQATLARGESVQLARQVDDVFADVLDPFCSDVEDVVSRRIPNRIGDGLGPLHNGTSCAECHRHGGAGGVEHNTTLITVDPRSEAVSDPTKQHGEQLLAVFPGLILEDGVLVFETVVHNRSARPGYEKVRNRLAEFVPGGIDDDWFVPEKRTSQAIADRPVVAGRHKNVDFYLSQRQPPPLFGLGQIDRIQVDRGQLAKEQGAKTGGLVTGRVAGKFGWRGQIDSLKNFVELACAVELGLTQSSVIQTGDPADFRYHAPGFDMTGGDQDKLVHFVSQISKPIERPLDQHKSSFVYAGEKVFNKIGCADCHIADLHPVMNLFSDLLLHDMGPELQAPSPAPVQQARVRNLAALQYDVQGPSSILPSVSYGDFLGSLPQPARIPKPETAQFPRGVPQDQKSVVFLSWDDLQREWRTPPLWGVGSTAPYLHDGRAETLEEAILWHGGEGETARGEFAKLDPTDRDRLLAFLSSLRAPVAPDSQPED